MAIVVASENLSDNPFAVKKGFYKTFGDDGRVIEKPSVFSNLKEPSLNTDSTTNPLEKNEGYYLSWNQDGSYTKNKSLLPLKKKKLEETFDDVKSILGGTKTEKYKRIDSSNETTASNGSSQEEQQKIEQEQD
ncbi:MAG: hypothetical protein ACTSXG_02720 [Alphaproteobacteria bacterium]